MKQETKKAIARKGKVLLLTGVMGLATIMTLLTFTACPNPTDNHHEIPPVPVPYGIPVANAQFYIIGALVFCKTQISK